jgi:hypothetical protein
VRNYFLTLIFGPFGEEPVGLFCFLDCSCSSFLASSSCL